jgi:hypothetical protein
MAQLWARQFLQGLAHHLHAIDEEGEGTDNL